MRYQIILEGKGGELDRCEVETEQEIRLELYHALIAAVDHLEGRGPPDRARGDCQGRRARGALVTA
jgi:hypothetical protein